MLSPQHSRSIEEEARVYEEERQEEDLEEVTKFYTNPIAKPVPHTLEGKPNPSLQDTITELNVRSARSNGLGASSEDISLGDDSVLEERDETGAPHPAGESLLRLLMCILMYCCFL